MKLVNTYYNIELEILENYVTVLSVENPSAYTKIIGDIWKQANGEDGDFVLSEDDKIKNISKEMECVFNPFSLDCNNKKVLSTLYRELKNQSDGMLQEDTLKLNSYIVEYLDKLVMTVNYNLKFNFDIDLSGIMKLYGVEVECNVETLLEQVVEYIKVMVQICNINLFVFVDIKHYLTEEDLRELYKTVFYEKVNLIIIEPIHTEKLEEEKSCIIDKDLCIIKL